MIHDNTNILISLLDFERRTASEHLCKRKDVQSSAYAARRNCGLFFGGALVYNEEKGKFLRSGSPAPVRRTSWQEAAPPHPAEKRAVSHLSAVGSTAGNLIRIYFLYDSQRDVIVVGSLPYHLKVAQIKA